MPSVVFNLLTLVEKRFVGVAGGLGICYLPKELGVSSGGGVL